MMDIKPINTGTIIHYVRILIIMLNFEFFFLLWDSLFTLTLTWASECLLQVHVPLVVSTQLRRANNPIKVMSYHWKQKASYAPFESDIISGRTIGVFYEEFQKTWVQFSSRWRIQDALNSNQEISSQEITLYFCWAWKEPAIRPSLMKLKFWIYHQASLL